MFQYKNLDFEFYDHSHNTTILNERAIECSLAFDFIEKVKDFIEIGCVMPHYTDHKQPCYDLTEKHINCINKDASELDIKGKNILSISSIEHFGTQDYGMKGIDSKKGIEFLKKILSQCNKYFLTVPIGYNRDIDNFIFSNVPNARFLSKDHNSTVNNWSEKTAKELTESEKSYGAKGNTKNYGWANTVCIIENFINEDQAKEPCDIIIVSNAKSQQLYDITYNAIKTCFESFELSRFKPYIWVLEQNQEVSKMGYSNFSWINEVATIFNGITPFNYNKSLNYGLQITLNKYVALCNNDLEFTPKWFDKVVRSMEQTGAGCGCPVSPKCATMAGNLNDVTGYRVLYEFNGACFVIDRKMVLSKISGNKINESPEFWYSDDVFVTQLQNAGIKNVLSSKAIVYHLGESTLNTLSKEEQEKLKNEQIKKLDIFVPRVHKEKKYNEFLLNNTLDNSQIQVFSAITAGYDKHRNGNIDLYSHTLFSGQGLFISPVMEAKIYKILPHLYFADTIYSIWIDGNVELKKEPKYYIQEYLKDNDICVFKHPSRSSIADEVDSIINVYKNRFGNDKKLHERLTMQLDFYKQHYKSFTDNSLFECGVIIRKHNENTEMFNEIWWSEICRFSERDQVSFPIAVWIMENRLKSIYIENYDENKLKLVTFNDSQVTEKARPNAVYNNSDFIFRSHNR